METWSSDAIERQALTRLIYVSQRTAGVTDHDVVEMALRASRRNRVSGVTGCLWFGNQQFFQILEGPRPTIDTLFARVRGDRRHCGVRVLSQNAILSREFSRWALTHLDDDEQSNIDDLVTHYIGNRLPPEASDRGISLSVFERVSQFISYPGRFV